MPTSNSSGVQNQFKSHLSNEFIFTPSQQVNLVSLGTWISYSQKSSRVPPGWNMPDLPIEDYRRAMPHTVHGKLCEVGNSKTILIMRKTFIPKSND